MVLFVNLEEAEANLYHDSRLLPGSLKPLSQDLGLKDPSHKPTDVCLSLSKEAAAREYMEKRSGFAAALSCYPAALSIASHLDLNDLYALSLTCHLIHDNLVQFSNQLIAHSLRCVNDSQPLLSDILRKHNEGLEFPDVHINAAAGDSTAVITTLLAALAAASLVSITDAGRMLQSNKIGECARDLVAGCRRCGKTVCRNCSAKPPSNRALRERFRRLCRACLAAPFAAHLAPFKDEHRNESPPISSASSAKSVIFESSSFTHPAFSSEAPAFSDAFTSAAFLRGPCNCVQRGVYLCTECGQNLVAADTTYKRVWTWRSRYSTHIGGGLGTGLGEGDQGQKCGRGQECLESGSAGVCWVEIDCSEKRNNRDSPRPSSTTSTLRPFTAEADRHRSVERDEDSDKPGYLQQEIEGIGGVVKKKVKKRIKVGATVVEYDDERASGHYLSRESSGMERSWCGWCSRVIPGEVDRVEMEKRGKLFQDYVG